MAAESARFALPEIKLAMLPGAGDTQRALHARFASSDAHEGMHAFLDKRKPAFQHR